MLKLKFQYFGHLMQRADSFQITLMLGKIEGRRRWAEVWLERGLTWEGWALLGPGQSQPGWTVPSPPLLPAGAKTEL